jgi:hypothetical protein
VIFRILEKFIVAKGCKFSLYELKFIGISNCNRVSRDIRYSRLDLTKARLRLKNKMSLCELAQVISAHVKKENRYAGEKDV